MNKYLFAPNRKYNMQLALILFLTLSTTFINAQDYKFKRYGLEQGLSHNSVTTIIQDSKGFLWFGTENGLNRFDGNEFKIFKHHVGNMSSISSNNIMFLAELDTGYIWVGTNGGGGCIYDCKKDVFMPLHQIADLPDKFLFTTIRDFIKLDTTYWAGSDLGVIRLHRKNNCPTSFFSKVYTFPESVSHDIKIDNIDAFNNIYASTGTSWSVYNKETDSFEHGQSRNRVVESIVINDTTLLLATIRGGLQTYNTKSKSFDFKIIPLMDRDCILTALHRDNSGIYWAGSYSDGLYMFGPDLDNPNTQLIKNDPNIQTSISANGFGAIFQDKSGILWFGTNTGGINKLNIRQNIFRFYPKESPNNTDKSTGTIRSLLIENDSLIWIGTRSEGLKLMNTNTGIVKSIEIKDGNRDIAKVIQSIVRDKNGVLWLATEGDGVVRYEPSYNDKTIGKSVPYYSRYNLSYKTKLTNGYVMKLLIDNKDRLWIGTWNGLNMLSADQMNGITHTETKFRIFYNVPDTIETISNNIIMTIYQDTENTIWCGTHLGLNKIIEHENGEIKFEHYKHDYFSENSLSDNVIMAIHEDKKGRFWVGTQNGGLNLFDRKTGKFEYYDLSKNLTNNTIHTINDDNNGNLWLGTNYGLICYNHEKKYVRTYKENDGTGNTEYQLESYGKAPNGRMFFGGSNGITAFHPDSIGAEHKEVPVEIISFKIFNQDVEVGKEHNGRQILSKAINYTKKITLRHTENNIAFEFAALDYNAPENIVYAYKLEGLDQEWITTTSRKRNASYSNLSEGNYTFKVKSTGSDGTWNKTHTELKITIIPPFWRTWWFRIIVTLAILLSILSFYKIRINALKRQKEILEKTVKERTAELQEANTILEEHQEEIMQQNEAIAHQKDQLEKAFVNLQDLTFKIEQSYKNAELLSEFGQKITASLNIEHISKICHELIKSLMPFSSFGIGIVNKSKKILNFPYMVENDTCKTDFFMELDKNQTFAGWSIKNKKDVFINDFDSEYKKFPSLKETPINSIEFKSIIIIPLMVENEAIGIVGVKSKEPNVYTESDFTNLKTLASYIAISFDNANAYKLVNLQNENIKGSIRCAKTIQNAFLPKASEINKYFEHFVIFKPKDIISGDFYWFWNTTENNKQVSYIAVADCTGHGVPGALMSIIGTTLFNHIIKELKIQTPNEILKELNIHFRKILQQDQTNNTDGMDIALCKIETDSVSESNKEYTITFSGAKRPLFLFKNKEQKIETISGVSKSIGGFQVKTIDYQNKEIKAYTGDLIYMFSDGYIDQANDNRKRLGSANLINYIKEIAPLTTNQQKEILETKLTQHQNIQEQRDDIILLGIRL